MKVISLFCGAGGLDLGFIRAGHKIIWANDTDKDAVNTYRRNIGSHVYCGNISEISTSGVPDADIIIGGFPCEGFSIVNVKRHTEDKRNKLYLELLRFIKQKKPKIFVAENVPGIMSLARGKVFEIILNDFSKAGYNIRYAILDAVNYGVPQFRKRVIFLGIRKDFNFEIYFPPEPTHVEDPGTELFTGHLRKWKTVNEAINDLPEPSENCEVYNHKGTKHKVKINGYVGNRPTRGHRPSPTIMGRGGGTGGPVIIPHPKLHRRLTPRECARLQDFPDDFVFEGSISSQYRQIGNAVPVGLAYNIAACIPIKCRLKRYRNVNKRTQKKGIYRSYSWER